MVQPITRRRFVVSASAALAAAGLARTPGASAARAVAMTKNLSGGRIGVGASGEALIALAQRHGFESIDPNAGHLQGLDDAALEAWRGAMKAADHGSRQIGNQ